MTQRAQIERPRLVGHARYRWDKVRKQHQVVFPEGMLVLNETGSQIVQRLDGAKTREELTAELVEQFADCRASDVSEFIRRLEKRGLLCDGTS